MSQSSPSPSSPPPDQPFWLGEILVHPQQRFFEVAGDRRTIDHKAMQVLLCLVAEAGHPVAKRDILSRVWQQEFVSEEVLTVAVSRLRRAIGDQARAPTLIETVPHVGYRLIAPLRRATMPSDESSTEAERRSPAHERSPRAARRRPLIALTLCLAVLVGGLGIVFWPFAKTQPIASLAVLPLTNLTGDDDHQHLAAGMTEALITGLVQQENLRIASHAAVRRFTDSRASLTDIARQLRVEAVITGSIQFSDGRLRIAAQVIDPFADRYLWAGTFDGPVSSLLELQETVVAEVAEQLLGASAVASEPAPLPLDPAAYEAYLRGRYLAGLGIPQRLPEAMEQFALTNALEPRFAAAWTALAEAHLSLVDHGLRAPGPAFETIRQAARRAIDLGDATARNRALLAIRHFAYDWDFVAAEREFRAAIDLDPRDVLARDWYSRQLSVLGRFDEALEQQRVLRELNPLMYHHPYLAFIYNMARRHQLALRALRQQFEIERNASRLYSHLASTYRWLGQPEQAMAPFLVYLRMRGAAPAFLAQVEDRFEAAGVAGVSRLLLQHLDQIEASGGLVAAMDRAEVLVLAGDLDAALDELERAFRRREPDLLLIAQSPDYDPLRGSPRFRDLLDRIGLPES